MQTQIAVVERKANPTPGPWSWCGREIVKYGEDWACIAIVCNPRPKDEDPTASPQPLDASSPRFHEAIGNARLIAAAPDMAATIREINEVLIDSSGKYASEVDRSVAITSLIDSLTNRHPIVATSGT